MAQRKLDVRILVTRRVGHARGDATANRLATPVRRVELIAPVHRAIVSRRLAHATLHRAAEQQSVRYTPCRCRSEFPPADKRS